MNHCFKNNNLRHERCHLARGEIVKLHKITGNCHELSLNNGVRLLFSYADVVAAYHPDMGWLKVNVPLSKASQWVVAEWFDKNGAENAVLVEQDAFDTLVAAPHELPICGEPDHNNEDDHHE
jgi:hypothetical protein